MSSPHLGASLDKLAHTLRHIDDIRRNLRVDLAISKDGRVVIEDIPGFIRMLANIDATRADVDATIINVQDALAELLLLQLLIDTVNEELGNTAQDVEDLSEIVADNQAETAQDVNDLSNAVGSLTSQQQDTSGVVSDIVGNLLPQKLPIADAPVTRRLVANSSTTSASQQPIGELFPTNDALAFVLAANTRYVLRANLDFQGSTTDGAFNAARFGIVLPAGATIQSTQIGWLSTEEPRWSYRFDASGITPGWNWNFNNTQRRDLEIRAFIQTASTAGIAFVAMAVMQAGETVTVYAGSSQATLEKSN